MSLPARDGDLDRQYRDHGHRASVFLPLATFGSGAVTVTSTGNITTTGASASGIFA